MIKTIKNNEKTGYEKMIDSVNMDSHHLVNEMMDDELEKKNSFDELEINLNYHKIDINTIEHEIKSHHIYFNDQLTMVGKEVKVVYAIDLFNYWVDEFVKSGKYGIIRIINEIYRLEISKLEGYPIDDFRYFNGITVYFYKYKEVKKNDKK